MHTLKHKEPLLPLKYVSKISSIPLNKISRYLKIGANGYILRNFLEIIVFSDLSAELGQLSYLISSLYSG
jgi:hypothetical protein